MHDWGIGPDPDDWLDAAYAFAVGIIAAALLLGLRGLWN